MVPLPIAIPMIAMPISAARIDVDRHSGLLDQTMRRDRTRRGCWRDGLSGIWQYRKNKTTGDYCSTDHSLG
jgi:hypothetical protein